MKFSVLAVDYNGTIAHRGVVHSEARAAIEEPNRRAHYRMAARIAVRVGRCIMKIPKAPATREWK